MPKLNTKEINYIKKTRRASIAPVSWMERDSPYGPPIYNTKASYNCNLYESLCRFLGCYKNVNVYNTSGGMINLVIKPHLTTIIKKIDIQKVGTIEMDTVGELKKCEINIGNGCYKNICVDTYNFYVTLSVYYNKVWRRVYVDRRLNVTLDIYVSKNVLEGVAVEVPDEEQTFEMRELAEKFRSADKIRRFISMRK